MSSGNTQPTLGQHIQQIDKEWDHYIRMAEMSARLRRVAFEELRNQGFNEAQALELCKDPIKLA